MAWSQTSDEGASVYLVVELKEGSDAAVRRDFRKLTRSFEVISKRAPRSYVANGEKYRARDSRRWQLVEVGADKVDEVERALLDYPAVVSVHREVIYREAVLANDPRVGEQYGLAAIGAPAVWERTIGSAETVIAIVDGGVDLSHEDLENKIWINAGEIAGNGVDDDGNGLIDDTRGWDFVENRPAEVGSNHGSHVAGIAAADSNNGLGGAGVDWQARIMPVRVLRGSGVGRETDIIRGIEYATAMGADVINLSLVGSESQALQDAIENAYAAGVTVVAAVGNNGVDTGSWPFYPACAVTEEGVDLVVGVGAIDDAGQPARFSNYGNCVDVWAPGDDILSTKLNNRYGEMSGTSMASPFAAGVAGLFLAVNPGSAPAEVMEALKKGELINEYGYRLNAAGVVGGAAPSPSSLPAGSATPPRAGGENNGGGGSGGGRGDGGGGSPGPDPEPEAVAKERVAGVIISAKANLSLLPRVRPTFNFVFGRWPDKNETEYWAGRVKRGEKRTYGALLGAMQYAKAKPKVLGTQKDNSPGGLAASVNALHRQAAGRNPTTAEWQYWWGRVTRGEKTTAGALLGAMRWWFLLGKSPVTNNALDIMR